MSIEKEVIKSFTEGIIDEKEFLNHIFEKYYTTLLGYSLSKSGGDREIAENSVQDTFLSFYKQIQSRGVNDIENLTNYLFTLLRHRTLDNLRKKKREKTVHLETAKELVEKTGLNQNEALQYLNLEELLQSSLSEDQRKAILLWAQGYTYESIADELETTSPRVRGLINRAKSKLVQEFKSRNQS